MSCSSSTWGIEPMRRIAALLIACLGLTCAALAVRAAETGPDGWTTEQLEVLRSLWIGGLGPPPDDSSNRFAQSEAAAALGAMLFHDKSLSANGELACTSCHHEDKALTDGRAKAHGLGDVARNAPSLFDVPYLPWLYWDGRRDSLWAQALTPFEAPNEMGTTRTELVRTVMNRPDLAAAYIAAFGPFPNGLAERIGAISGGPFAAAPEAAAAWNGAKEADRELVNAAFANLGKAVAAYETTFRHTPSRFDRYVESLIGGRKPAPDAQLNTDEKAGLTLFLNEKRTRCLRCHNGPLFTNYDFHNVGTGTFDGPVLDYGRVFGLNAAQLDEFNCLGPYSDTPAKAKACYDLRFAGTSDHTGSIMGAFKVPGLRNVAVTGPYMHDGRFATLREVIEHYRTPLTPEGTAHELIGVNFTEAEMAELESFLRTLTDGDISPGE